MRLLIGSCGDPATGICCVAHAAPFCSDAACCSTTCSADPFCCTTTWDAGCASYAQLACGQCVPAASNDDCTTAQPIGVGTHPFTTLGAAGMTGGVCADFGNPNIYNDIWFAYTATGAGECIVSTCGLANFDTKIAVFRGACQGPLVACNDDFASCGGYTSRVSFATTCGDTYLICIGAYSAAGRGFGQFQVEQSGSCAPPCRTDLNHDGRTDGADLAMLLGSWGTALGDVNDDGLTDGADLAMTLGAWGACG